MPGEDARAAIAFVFNVVANLLLVPDHGFVAGIWPYVAKIAGIPSHVVCAGSGGIQSGLAYRILEAGTPTKTP